MATGDYTGRPVVVNAPVVPVQPAPFRPPPGALVVPVPGRDGTSIEIIDTVPTYGDLPDGLGPEDRGKLWVVAADGLGYPWNGVAFPAVGAGVEIRGPQGKRGISITRVTVDGGDLVISFDDDTTNRVTIPAIQAAIDAADAAAGSATAAADSETAAAGSASAAHDDAVQAAADRSQTGLDRAATGADRTATGEDRNQTGADRAATGQDRVAAQQARIDAQTARDTAAGHATVAGQHASDASDSSGTAASAAAAAQGHAGDAAGSATLAGQHATAAEGWRDQAEQFAQDAKSGAPAGGWLKTDLHADVQDSLGRADSASQPGHGHTINDISGLDAALAGKSDAGHKHTTADVQGLQQVIDQAVADLVAGAPGALDTLAELAAALGNDPNFATTVSDQIGERAKTTDVTAWLATKSDTGHKHTATDITDATSTGRGVITGTAQQGRDALSVPSKAEMRARPAMWIWDGHGTWTPPAGAVATDTVLNLDTGELHSVEEI